MNSSPTATYWQQVSTAPRWQVILCAIVAVAAPLLLYLPSLRYGFVYDDLPLVAHNESIRSIDAAMGYFFHDFDGYTRGAQSPQSNYYRPLVFLFMALLWPWAGDDPSHWHAVVLALNALVGGLAFAVLRVHGMSLGRALLGALVFSLHPLHVHSAAWITGLHDVLAGVFTLAGYLCLVRWLARDTAASPRGPSWYALAGFVAMSAAGLLAKESTLALLLLALMHAVWTAGRVPTMRGRAVIMGTTASLLIAGYLVLRWHVLGAIARPFPTAPAWPEAIASIAPLCWAYLSAWLWPVDLSLFSSFRPLAVAASATALLSWAGALAAAGALIVLIHRQRFWLWPLLFTGCLLAPYLNLRALNPEWALMHRYLYLPSLGMAWMVALLPVPSLARRAAPACALALLGLLAMGSAHDMRAYRDEWAFWDKAVQKDPHSSAAWTERGRLLQERGEGTAARDALQRASDLDPGSLLPRLRLGNLQFSAHEYAAAAASYREITARQSDYPLAWRNLASALLAAGDKAAALKIGDEALQRFPQDADVLNGIGTVRRLAGDLPGAIAAFQSLAALRPGDAAVWLRLASLQAESGDVANARGSLARLKSLTRDAALLSAAAQLSAQLGQPSP